MERLRLDKRGIAYVNFFIKPFDSLILKPIEFKLDTGASVTTISTDMLHKLGYGISSGKEKRIITASSVEYVRPVMIDKISIGGIELENIEVYAHTFPESSFSLGVLGLNVLRHFDVSLFFSKKEIELIRID